MLVVLSLGNVFGPNPQTKLAIRTIYSRRSTPNPTPISRPLGSTLLPAKRVFNLPFDKLPGMPTIITSQRNWRKRKWKDEGGPN